MSEDLTELAQEVRRCAKLVRDIKAESDAIDARMKEIHGTDDDSSDCGQLHFAIMALEDARKRLEGTEDEPVTQEQRDAYSETVKADFDSAFGETDETDNAGQQRIRSDDLAEFDPADLPPEASTLTNGLGPSPFSSDY